MKETTEQLLTALIRAVNEMRAELSDLRRDVADLKCRFSYQRAEEKSEPLNRSSVLSIRMKEEPKEGDSLLSKSFTVPEPGISPTNKIRLFRSLFSGRDDVYAVRWISKVGKTGYSPKCRNHFIKGKCSFPCSKCSNQSYEPLSDEVIQRHLMGQMTVGVYPVVNGSDCRFAVLDFDDQNWQSDGRAVIATARRYDVPIVPEISRSAAGVHLWLFFSEVVPASLARGILDRLLGLTMHESDTGIKLDSFDRIIPCQDKIPNGGLGNLVALPMQPLAKEKGGSLFTDDDLKPVREPWKFMQSIRRMSSEEASKFLEKTGQCSLSTTEDDPAVVLESEELPWNRGQRKIPLHIAEGMSALHVRVDNALYFRTDELTPALQTALIRLASFRNPEFLKKEEIHLPLWRTKIHRFLSYAKLYPKWLEIPRGLFSRIRTFLDENGIRVDFEEQRTDGGRINVSFNGVLHPEQKLLLDSILGSNEGVVIAPTGFGKTVVGTALIACRGVSTLVVMNRQTLIAQWKKSCQSFLSLQPSQIGEWTGKSRKKTGSVDLALFQSLCDMPLDQLRNFLADYGQVIVDECHHLGGAKFGKVLENSPSRYRIGFTATLKRSDGLEKAVPLLCGPILKRIKSQQAFPITLTVKRFSSESFGHILTHARLLNELAIHAERNRMIADVAVEKLKAGKRLLVLSQRCSQVVHLANLLRPMVSELCVLSSDMKEKDRERELNRMNALPSDAPRLILATGQLAGEGFDHAPLDTLLLALPVSGQSVIIQYIGRILRQVSGKTSAEIIDVVDAGNPILESQWMKRQKEYRRLNIHSGADNQSRNLFS